MTLLPHSFSYYYYKFTFFHFNVNFFNFYTGAKILASKFYGLYALLADLLSAQKHYDWGLRAVKSVLRIAGGMLRAEPELDEAAILSGL